MDIKVSLTNRSPGLLPWAIVHEIFLFILFFPKEIKEQSFLPCLETASFTTHRAKGVEDLAFQRHSHRELQSFEYISTNHLKVTTVSEFKASQPINVLVAVPFMAATPARSLYPTTPPSEYRTAQPRPSECDPITGSPITGCKLSFVGVEGVRRNGIANSHHKRDVGSQGRSNTRGTPT